MHVFECCNEVGIKTLILKLKGEKEKGLLINWRGEKEIPENGKATFWKQQQQTHGGKVALKEVLRMKAKP